MSTINRNNYNEHWLEYEHFNHNSKFMECRLKEIPGSRELIKNSLNEAILQHHFPVDKIASHLDKLKLYRLAKELPTKNTRTGNFGEIVASEHICQHHNYHMPVNKLIFRELPGMPVRGEDIVAFKMENDRIMTLCIGEAKTSASFRPSEVKKAHVKLEKTYSANPLSLTLISNILWNNKEKELAEQVDDILEKLGSDDFPRENWIFIISGNKPVDPFDRINRLPNVVKNLYVVSLHLDNLSNFINEMFSVEGLG